MSEKGLSHLLATIMAAGNVPALDARDHRLAHEALRSLSSSEGPAARSALKRFGVEPVSVSDPEVGRRVPGVTVALWDAAQGGLLVAEEFGFVAEFRVNPARVAALRSALLGMPPEEARVLYRTGAAWAAASTARKKSVTPRSSVAVTRRVKLA